MRCLSEWSGTLMSCSCSRAQRSYVIKRELISLIMKSYREYASAKKLEKCLYARLNAFNTLTIMKFKVTPRGTGL